MITIFSTPNCVNCNAIKTMYKSNQIEFEEKTIGVDITKEDLETLTGTTLRSAPVIMNGDTYVGGIHEGVTLMNELQKAKVDNIQKQMTDELKALGIAL